MANSLCEAESVSNYVKNYLILVAKWEKTGFNLLAIVEQLVQFLLKQAGVDKRTDDLYGNRDFLNIARNMARGLKVCWKRFYLFAWKSVSSFSYISISNFYY